MREWLLRTEAGDRRGIILVTLLCLVLCWLGNGHVSLWDRDEPRYAGTARAMRERGDFIVPYFNGVFRFQKPALTYWLVAAAQALLGDNEFSARCVSGLLVAAVCPIVWRLGNDMFGRPAGLLAAGMLALSPLAVMLGKLCIPDGPQFFCATACFALLYAAHAGSEPNLRDARARTHESNPRNRFVAAFDSALPSPAFSAGRWQVLGFWLALAATVLLKGPIVAGMLAASLITYRFLARVPLTSFRLCWQKGLIVLCLVTLPWLGAIYCSVGRAFFAESLGKQIVDRAVVAFDGRLLPPGYYAASLLVGFAPWLPLSFLALVRFRGRWRTAGPVAFLIAWLVGPMVLLELFRSKQLHYYGPAYPALALLAAGYLAAVFRNEVVWIVDRTSRRSAGAMGLLGLVLAGVFMGLGLFGPPAGRVCGLLCSVVSAGGSLWAARQFAVGRLARSLATQSLALATVWLLLGGWHLPALDSQRIVRTVAEHLGQAHRRSGTPIVLHQRLFEPSMVYYAGLAFPDCLEDAEYLSRLRTSDRTVLTALTEADYQRLAPKLRGQMRIRGTFRGWVRMHPDVVHLIAVAPAAEVLAERPARRIE